MKNLPLLNKVYTDYVGHKSPEVAEWRYEIEIYELGEGSPVSHLVSIIAIQNDAEEGFELRFNVSSYLVSAEIDNSLPEHIRYAESILIHARQQCDGWAYRMRRWGDHYMSKKAPKLPLSLADIDDGLIRRFKNPPYHPIDARGTYVPDPRGTYVPPDPSSDDEKGKIE